MTELPIGPVPEEWKVARLQDVTVKIGSGATPRGGSSVYVGSGTAFIRSQNVLDHEFSTDGLVFIDESAAYELRGVTVQEDDVLLNITGDSILRTCVVPPRLLPARVSQHVAILRPGPSLDSLFLQKYLTIQSVKEYMLGHSAGGTRKAITKGHIEGFVLPLPPLSEQQAIADVIGALDDKIESNRRLRYLVDGLVRAEFAVATTSSGVEQTDFESIALRVSRPARPHDLDAETPYVGLEHVPRGVLIVDDWGNAEGLESGKSFFSKGDVLFGKLRPYFKKVGVAPVAGVCSTDILVLRPRRSLSLLAAVAASDEFIAYSSAAATGTKMPRVSWEYLAKYKVSVPDSETESRFDKVVGPSIERATRSVIESRALQSLRDALLPELLSGRLRVRDAEKVVGEVV